MDLKISIYGYGPIKTNDKEIKWRTFSLQYYDLAADVLAENAHLTYKYLTPVSITSHSFQIL